MRLKTSSEILQKNYLWVHWVRIIRLYLINKSVGYSLDAQKDKLRKYAEFQDVEIVGEYSDEGHSGKNIKGRQEFMRMYSALYSLCRIME